MKLLLLLFLVGFVSASSFYDVLDDAADELVRDFMAGMEEAPTLKRALGYEEDEEADIYFAMAEDEIKTELGKKLREALDKVLQKVKDAIERGKTVRGDLIEKLKELKEKLKDVKGDIGAKAKDLLQKIKEKAKDLLQKLLDNLDEDKQAADTERIDFSLKEVFRKLKKAIKSSINKEKLKEHVEKLFGKGSELADKLLNILKEKGEKGKQKILDWIDRVLDEEEQSAPVEQRSIKEMWEKVKNYFKDLKIDLKEKFAKFGEWVKETVKKGLDKSKSKMDNIRTIASEFVKHAQNVSKEIAVEALEFLRPYKDDLGQLWIQVKEAVKDIVQRKGD